MRFSLRLALFAPDSGISVYSALITGGGDVAELVYFAPRRRNAVVDLAVAPLYGWPVTLGRPLLVFRSAEAFLGSIIYARHFLAGLFMVAGVGALFGERARPVQDRRPHPWAYANCPTQRLAVQSCLTGRTRGAKRVPKKNLPFLILQLTGIWVLIKISLLQ
jgi:hypothetical protein